MSERQHGDQPFWPGSSHLPMQGRPSKRFHNPDFDLELVLVEHVAKTPQRVHPCRLARRIAHPDQQVNSTFVDHALRKSTQGSVYDPHGCR